MGCPHQCLYCDQTSITGQSKQLPISRSIDNHINRFLAYNRRQRAFTEVSFFGGNFLGLRTQEILNLLNKVIPFIHSGAVDGIRFSTRPDTITLDRLKLIAPFPISTVEIGVQSMNDQILRRIRRGHTATDTRRAMSLLHQSTRYNIGLQMMLGLPGDSFDDLINSAKQMAALHPDFIRIYPLLVLKGSPLADWYLSGKYTPISLNQAIEQTKHLYRLFHQQNIAVIRMGLQASVELKQDDTVLAGPYHPAFGHLVWSSIYLDGLRRLISRSQQKERSIKIYANPKDISRVQGMNKSNFDQIGNEFDLSTISIIPDPSLPIATLALEDGTNVAVLEEGLKSTYTD